MTTNSKTAIGTPDDHEPGPWDTIKGFPSEVRKSSYDTPLGPWDTEHELPEHLKDAYTPSPDLSELTLEEVITNYPDSSQSRTTSISILRGPDYYFRVRDYYTKLLDFTLTSAAKSTAQRHLLGSCAILQGTAFLLQDLQLSLYRLNLDLLEFTANKCDGEPFESIFKRIHAKPFVFPTQKDWKTYTITSDDAAICTIENIAQSLGMWPGAIGIIAMWMSLKTLPRTGYYELERNKDLAVFSHYIRLKNTLVYSNLMKYPNMREAYTELLTERKGENNE